MSTKVPVPPFAVSAEPATQTDATHPGTYAAVAEASGQTVHDVGVASALTLTVTVHSTPGGTTPTLDAKIQESNDKTNWADITGAAITQFAGTASAQPGTNTAKVPGSAAATDALTFARWVRVVAAVGGTATPTYSVTYMLYRKP